MHSGHSHLYRKEDVFLGLCYRQVSVSLNKLDAPHGSLPYHRRLGGTLLRKVWNYCKKFNSSHHSRENDPIGLTANSGMKMIHLDWQFNPSYQFEHFSAKTLETDRVNIQLHLFTLGIIVIWGNFLGNVYFDWFIYSFF